MGQTRPTHFELWTVESELIHSPLFTCSVNSWGGRKGRKRGGPAVLLAVADRRMAWTAVGPSSSSVCFFSALFFLSFPVLFLLPLSGRSSISMVAIVIAHGAGGDSGGWMWLQMVVPNGSFSSFLFCFCFSSVCLCFCFFFCFSRCKGCYQWRGGRWQLAVALVAAIQTTADGSFLFLSFFVFTSKTWQWRWWCCCCSSCLCRGAGFFFTGVAQQGEEDGERLRKNDNGVGSAGGSGSRKGKKRWPPTGVLPLF